MRRRDFLVSASSMLGCALSPATIAAVSSNTESGVNTSGRVLSKQQRATVVTAAEAILPRTDTPGATDAEVADFIELIVCDWYTAEERQQFYSGLDELNNLSERAVNTPFANASSGIQAQLLLSMESSAQAKPETQPFYTQLKELTVVGYFTSEVGAKQALMYNPMPMKYDGEYPISKATRQWSY